MQADRHQNNFGALRNADTLEWIGAAPLYDNGSSLWFDKPAGMIGRIKGVTCKPFKSSHKEQLQLVSSLDWLDLDRLFGIEEKLQELTKDSLFIDTFRTQKLCKALRNRIYSLEEIANGFQKRCPFDDHREDLTEDIRYNGEG